MTNVKNEYPYPIMVLTTGEENRVVNVIKSPTKLKILNLLENKKMHFRDIVNALGKAKSTVSIHLRQLADKNLINYEQDSKDSRKKIFFLNSNVIAEIDFIKQGEGDFDSSKTEKFLTNIIENDPRKDFIHLISHSVRSKLLENRISLYPLIHETGIEVGESIYKRVNSDSDEGLIKNLAEFWEEYNLGRLKIEKKENTIEIKDYECSECAPLPKLDLPICCFTMGVLEVILKNHYKSEIDIREELCMTMGSDYCLFIAKKKE